MKLRQVLSVLLTSILASSVYAKSIQLYVEPKIDAKLVGSINSDTGIIPIYSPKNSQWLKVGDPTNGNVGWIKTSDLEKSGFTFTQHIISTGKNPQSYQVIQYGNSKEMSPEQIQATFQKLQTQQKQLQEDTQKMLKDMYKNFNQQLMPIVIMPAQPANPAKK